jgi:nucleoside-diphosphate-sugar epimerase
VNVVVTGATGFIGSHLLPALLREGHRVKALIEPGVDAVQLKGVDSFPADIVSGNGLSAGFSWAEAVVHLAARNHVLKETARDPLAAYRRVNVDGTRNVVQAASLAGVRLFVHLSSVKAMGEESESLLDEESPCLPKTPYGISKLESEDAVRVVAEKCGMKAVLFRLPMVYGPGNKGNLPRMIRWAARGYPFPLFQPDNVRSMIYVENAVAGILAVLKNAPAGPATYMLKDSEDCSTKTVYSIISRELGMRPRFLPVPAAVVRFGGILSEDFRKITGSFRVSAAKIGRELGFIPPFSVQEGLARTVRWHMHPGC